MKLGLKRPFARKLHKSPENRRNNVITDEKEILYLPLKRLDIVILIQLLHMEMKKQLEMQFKIC